VNLWLLQYRSWISWGLLLLVLLLLASLIGKPLLDRHLLYDREIERDRMTIDRLTAIADSRESIEKAYNEFRARGLNDWVSSSQNGTQQALDVQKRITEIVHARGAQLSTVKAVIDNQGGYQIAGVDIKFSADMEPMLLILEEIENLAPPVFITKLALNPQAVRRSTRQPQAITPQKVIARLTIVTYTQSASNSGGER